MVRQRAPPAFLQKLYTIFNGSTDAHIARWSPDGKTIVIDDVNRWEREVAPSYFSTSRVASFVRSLHYYSFQKLDTSQTRLRFSHPCFLRGREDLLRYIVRKTNSSSAAQAWRRLTPAQLVPKPAAASTVDVLTSMPPAPRPAAHGHNTRRRRPRREIGGVGGDSTGSGGAGGYAGSQQGGVRVTLFNTASGKKLSGGAAPSRANLEAYLRRRPEMAVLNEDDSEMVRRGDGGDGGGGGDGGDGGGVAPPMTAMSRYNSDGYVMGLDRHTANDLVSFLGGEPTTFFAGASAPVAAAEEVSADDEGPEGGERVRALEAEVSLLRRRLEVKKRKQKHGLGELGGNHGDDSHDNYDNTARPAKRQRTAEALPAAAAGEVPHDGDESMWDVDDLDLEKIFLRDAVVGESMAPYSPLLSPRQLGRAKPVAAAASALLRGGEVERPLMRRMDSATQTDLVPLPMPSLGRQHSLSLPSPSPPPAPVSAAVMAVTAPGPTATVAHYAAGLHLFASDFLRRGLEKTLAARKERELAQHARYQVEEDGAGAAAAAVMAGGPGSSGLHTM